MPETAPFSMRIVGRYALHGVIASGGMATVHLGRLLGEAGFSRTVAIKKLHRALAMNQEFATMFLDEARLAARVRHPNVVPVLDVVTTDGELLLVMEYVLGESLARLIRMAGGGIEPRIAVSILVGALHGLHAAHEAKTQKGEPLDLVHRDVSPHNVLVGIDGITRVTDFGVAKASHRLHATREGQIKGKLSYMAPEQLTSRSVDRRADVWAAGAVLWEALTGQRLYSSSDPAETVRAIAHGLVTPPSQLVPQLLPGLEAIVLRALSLDPAHRFPTAREMARALEATVPPATAGDVGEWVEYIASQSLNTQKLLLSEVESTSAKGSLTVAAHAALKKLDPSSGPPSSGMDGSQTLPIDSGKARAQLLGATIDDPSLNPRREIEEDLSSTTFDPDLAATTFDPLSAQMAAPSQVSAAPVTGPQTLPNTTPVQRSSPVLWLLGGAGVLFVMVAGLAVGYLLVVRRPTAVSAATSGAATTAAIESPNTQADAGVTGLASAAPQAPPAESASATTTATTAEPPPPSVPTPAPTMRPSTTTSSKTTQKPTSGTPKTSSTSAFGDRK